MLIASGGLLAQQHGQAPLTYKVQVLVMADDDIQMLAERYIMRELRLRHDVTIVEENTEWDLRFNVKVLSTVEGKRLGFAMSVTTARLHNVSLFQKIFKDTTSRDMFNKYLKGSYDFVYSYLHVGPIDGLQELCGRAVADIDINALERRGKSAED